MKMILISIEECLSVARKMKDTDNENEQSTWIFDTPMQNNCKCFKIMVEDKEIGFTVFRYSSFSYCYWLSLYKEYRHKGLGAMAFVNTVDYLWSELKANKILSEVFEDNLYSISIHDEYFLRQKNVRILNDKNVVLFELTKTKWKEDCEKCDKYGNNIYESLCKKL